MQKIIEFEDKVALNENADIPEINKITDDNINEIKSVVNGSLQGTNAMGSIVVDDINCKNMFDPNSVIKNASVNNGVIFSTTGFDIYVIKVVPNQTYTISKTSYNGGLIGYYSSFPAIGNTLTNLQTLRNVTELTITAQDNYLCMMIAQDDDIGTIQVERGSTKTTYTPYKNFDTTIKSVYLSGTTSANGNLSSGINKDTNVVLCFHANNNNAIPTFYTNTASNEWTVHLNQVNGQILANTQASGTLYYIELYPSSSTSGTRMLSVESEEENR